MGGSRGLLRAHRRVPLSVLRLPLRGHDGPPLRCEVEAFALLSARVLNLFGLSSARFRLVFGCINANICNRGVILKLSPRSTKSHRPFFRILYTSML